MEFFKKFFRLTDDDIMPNGEYSVCCPFPHKDHLGNEYLEKNPSAHINPERNVFHCKVCGFGRSEVALLSEIEGISYRDALRALKRLEDADKSDWSVREQNLRTSADTVQFVKDLGLYRVVSELRLGFNGDGIEFPVFMYGELVDVRNYHPTRKPKVKGRPGSTNMILPFDLWREDTRDTILAAGEKDMAIAREMGYNAITFTGGEGSFPKLFKYSFKGRKVYIIYDNDDAGREGAVKAAHFIKEAGGYPYVVTGHYKTCTQKGEDLWDFFMLYGKKKEDLDAILAETAEADGKLLEAAAETVTPSLRVGQVAQGGYANTRFVRSKVTVLSIFDDMFNVPEYVRFKKTIYEEDSIFRMGEEIEWVLDENNIEDVLYLMDGKITKSARDKSIKSMVGISPQEEGISMTVLSSVDVYKSVVTDVIDTSDRVEDSKIDELLIYTIGKRLMAGKQYEIVYKPVSHPLDGMRLVGIMTELKEAASSIENFKVTPEVKDSLRVFQQTVGDTVTSKIKEQFERSKGFIGVEAKYGVMLATDLFYHTPLEFMIGNRTERAYIDAMIIGDPRTMKSHTAKMMREMYELGTIVSLKTASAAGLIGGSDKAPGGGFKTKIGVIPQSHKGAVIMEEFSGGGRQLISQLTEIRSSGRVRITRVNGVTDVAAQVRMLSISNPATRSGISLSLNQYPSGIKVLLDLIGASEDIARYDFFLLVEETRNYTSPLDAFNLDPYPKESYMNRIRWVWSRKAEQVRIERNIAELIVKAADKLNEDYDSHMKIFGAEAWKKLSKVAIAVAGMLVSTDESFERLIVKEEHVRFAYSFLKGLYDNELFKLRNYVEAERAYNECREADVAALQKLYNTCRVALDEMEISTDLTQKQLQLVSGLDMKEFGELISKLGASKFIQWQGERIVPTGKFRVGMRKINKNVYLKAASERN